MAESIAKEAYFLIADISGYTKFMAEAEIQHAKGILEGLFNAILPTINQPLEVSSLQGDAVFSYAFASDAVGGQYLLDIADTVYAAFRDSREKMEINTSCTCKACGAIGALELKIVIHHGECVMQKSNGRNELAGRDVITAFRLLKNSVKEQTGMNAYNLVTCAAVKKMGVSEIFADYAHYTENIEHIGEVEFVVADMEAAWSHRRGKEPLVVGDDDILLYEERVWDIPASPQIVFTACSRRDLRMIWLGADRIDLISSSDGRVEEGSQFHCYHGDDLIRAEIADWAVGEHLTMHYRLPLGFYGFETMFMQPIDGGTRVVMRTQRFRTKNLIGKLMAKKVNSSLLANYDEERMRGGLHDLCVKLQAEAKTPAVEQVAA